MIPVINELASFEGWAVVVASQDWHPAGHCSFASSHASNTNQPAVQPFDTLEFAHPEDPTSAQKKTQTVWPDHCVQGTRGTDFPPEFTGLDRIDHTVRKGMLPDREYYSAFQDVWGLHQTELASVLSKAEVTDVFVVGLAFDFCVAETALDAARFLQAERKDTQGLGSAPARVHVVAEATKPVDPGVWDSMARRLKAGGVDIIGFDNRILGKIKKPQV